MPRPPLTPTNILGAALRARREALGLTQEGAGAVFGVAQATWKRVEVGGDSAAWLGGAEGAGGVVGGGVDGGEGGGGSGDCERSTGMKSGDLVHVLLEPQGSRLGSPKLPLGIYLEPRGEGEPAQVFYRTSAPGLDPGTWVVCSINDSTTIRKHQGQAERWGFPAQDPQVHGFTLEGAVVMWRAGTWVSYATKERAEFEAGAVLVNGG